MCVFPVTYELVDDGVFVVVVIVVEHDAVFDAIGFKQAQEPMKVILSKSVNDEDALICEIVPVIGEKIVEEHFFRGYCAAMSSDGALSMRFCARSFWDFVAFELAT